MHAHVTCPSKRGEQQDKKVLTPVGVFIIFGGQSLELVNSVVLSRVSHVIAVPGHHILSPQVQSGERLNRRRLCAGVVERRTLVSGPTPRDFSHRLSRLRRRIRRLNFYYNFFLDAHCLFLPCK